MLVTDFLKWFRQIFSPLYTEDISLRVGFFILERERERERERENEQALI